MTTLVQNNQTIPEFYQAVYHHLSLILNKLSSTDMGQESLNVMTQAYRYKALDTFIRELKGDLPRLLSIREPTDLPHALHLCLKLENVHYRVQHSHGTFRTIQSPIIRPPPLPPKRNNFHLRSEQPRTPFYPQLVRNPQVPPRFTRNFHRPMQQPQQFQRQFQRPPINNSFRRPEPMDENRSIHSRVVNYQNRPPIQKSMNKRMHSQQTQQPSKFQRIFYTKEIPNETIGSKNYYEYNQEIDYNKNLDPILTDYVDQQINPDASEESDEIHFLG